MHSDNGLEAALERIMVATDFSERSHRAVRRAAMLADESGASLLLLHVADDDRDPRIVDADVGAARARLEEMKAAVPAGVACEARVMLGYPFDGIVRAAREWQAGLVVMGAHRRQFLRDIFVGTSIERVTRSRVAPVLMVNAEPRGPYRRALVGIDFSEHSAGALRFAREAGFLGKAELAFVHAYQVFGKGQMIFAGVDPEKLEAHAGREEARARAQLATFLERHGHGAVVGSRERLAEGPPAVVIARVARSVEADLVVVATHGDSGAARLLLGSVAETVMRDLDRDVLAVPPAA